jgi:hypothetical protein
VGIRDVILSVQLAQVGKFSQESLKLELLLPCARADASKFENIYIKIGL